MLGDDGGFLLLGGGGGLPSGRASALSAMWPEGKNMLIIWGLRVVYRVIARGTFYCRKCGGDRRYRHQTGRRFITVFFIPLIPLTKTGDHVQCVTCKTRYVTDVLNAPTASAMQAAIPAGVRAMVALMLASGGIDSAIARKRAVDAVRASGMPSFDEGALDADQSQAVDAARMAVARFGVQLRPEAREWHLAEVLRIAMADGPLSPGERSAAESLATDLGMTRAQAVGVITLTEQAADPN
jgi:hypothetical protein